MPKRRGHNEGSIYQRKSDNKWVAAVTVYTGDGRRRRKTRVCRTRAEAKKALQELLADLRAGRLAAGASVTTGDYLATWLDSVKHGLRPRTLESYSYIVRHHLSPEIGRIKLERLTPAHVQDLLDRKLAAGLSPRTVRYIFTVLNAALGRAVKFGILTRNPCDVVEAPKVERKEMQALTPAQAARFLAAAREDRFHALFVLAVTCGLRQGELLGLRWEDVDFDAATLTVQRQLQWDRAGKRFVLAQTKTGRGRQVPLPPVAVDALRRHRARQAQERLLVGSAWCNDYGALVFTTAVGTPVRPENLVRRHFKPVLERAGLAPIPFHALRHTCATLMLQAGIPMKVVQSVLGHASISTTADIYMHVDANFLATAAARVEDLLAGGFAGAG
ncbi:tyrosine-type recombinase/integrase [Thermaerobacter sp. FW80]|uniref:tyrosine-type recombinase/integrase n=1 Tax=Thermaerobacter sp. FW80 TaxID=2546351 RepID=UPI001FAAB615|nr:tyrosine-type recombinase/integrase [Thermaerobacter sp. FW80]